MTKLRKSLLALTALASAGLLAACGTQPAVSASSFSGAQRNVAQAVSNFQSDAQSHNESKLCQDDLASSVVAKLDVNGHTCTAVMSKQLNEVDDFALSFEKTNAITITGNTAVARVKTTVSGKSNKATTLKLVKQGSSWRIASLNG
jgi:hypothetical protein